MTEGTLEEDDHPRTADGFSVGMTDGGDVAFYLYDGEGETIFAVANLRLDDIDGIIEILRSHKRGWAIGEAERGITELEASRGHIERECGEPFTKLYKVGTRVRSACDDDPRLRPLLPAGDGTVLHIQVDEAGALLTVGWDGTGATSVTRPHRLKAAPK